MSRKNDTDPGRTLRSLGVETRSVSDRSTARGFELPRVVRGALVSRVVPGMPAAQAGLQRGEVITEIRVGRGAREIGYSIGSSTRLESVLIELSHLSRVTVEAFRGPAPLNRSSYATQLFRVRLER
jgi:S1-C subfamily serine protease